MKRLILWLASILILTACSSTRPTQYYQLPDSAFRLPENKVQPIAVKVILAEPLKNNGLVYQTDVHTVHFAQNHLWAAPLEHSLAAVFANKFNRIGNHSFAPATHHLNTNGTLLIYLDRFQGRHTGDTEISGYAIWQNQHQQKPISRQSFHVITPQTGDGYTAMIQSLDKGLNQVVTQLIP
ncbi:MAG: ABC-type transport auxiliary lipoprotein family protein [Alysiella sp.]|uniref:PqiC family protein n=1 Tax=Alysiella sp. TaxID=1872483 RepID=UPI0026DC88A3|nr:ABC-type transport auxiliary lipoprotein family protein [Alysiella sp.]MDO4433927.1 ABC-type transport auxiliary lipoprotein family protein [Alysiella sp.]